MSVNSVMAHTFLQGGEIMCVPIISTGVSRCEIKVFEGIGEVMSMQ